MKDPIVDELHRLREKALEEVDFDFHQFCERLRERERASQRKVVAPPKPQPKSKATVKS
jgi:hypothetical protein